MTGIHITYAGELYDRTWALKDGSVKPEGIDLTYLAFPVEEVFWRMLKHKEFEMSEMSLSSYTMLVSDQKDVPFVAIPVFPSRFFRHGFIFINADSGIQEPSDLEGKRVGVPEYEMTAAVWMRGLLKHEYGVDLNKIKWYIGGLEAPGREEKLPLKRITVNQIPHGKTLSKMLESREIDALLSARVPSSFYTSSKIRRLFPNFREIEMEYYRKTEIFPIMHTVVLRENIYQRYPWVAQSMFKAFEEAKEICYRKRNLGALPYTLAWFTHYVEEEMEILGEDPWPYGLEPNRKVLETFLDYSYEQKLIGRRPEVEELFAENTLDRYII
jgi:4,5-dihydroxyphthalate decarboxylase